MKTTRKYTISLYNYEINDLESVLKDFFNYMEKLGMGEHSSRTMLAQALIDDINEVVKAEKEEQHK